MVCPCCVSTGTCCEFSCTGCGQCDYEWDGQKYALIGGTIGPCPTANCSVSECPPSGADFPNYPVTEYIEGVNFLIYSPCCEYPDSIWICNEVAGPDCYSGSWAQGQTCAETEEEIQTQCQEQAFP